MPNRKIDTELLLSLGLNDSQRERSLDLDVGYDREFNEWELIVKHKGNIADIASELNMTYTLLLSNFAIVRIRENLITTLSDYDEVLFIEKPKSLILEYMPGVVESCIPSLQGVTGNNLGLFGAGTIVAIIDSGIDYKHPDFRNSDGSTRILSIWDQGLEGNPPTGYDRGTEYTSEDINQALLGDNSTERQLLHFDSSGHGTAVAGIAAGNGRASDGRIVGVAPQASILVVKLAKPEKSSFPSTIQLILGLNYVIEYGRRVNMPVAINVSFGNNYGAHNGTAMLELYMDSVSDEGRISICVGSGNDGGSGRHQSGTICDYCETKDEISISSYEQGINLSIWKSYADDISLSIIAPNGSTIGPIYNASIGRQLYRIGRTEVALYIGSPTPYNSLQEVYIALIPQIDYIDEGLWSIILRATNVVSGKYNMWLPVAGSISTATAFLRPSLCSTLTIPSTAADVISVGAYDILYQSVPVFSGRGFRSDYGIKPDLVAPGVDILAASEGGGYSLKTGTSFSTPFVTGAAALLMEWGDGVIIRLH